MSNLKLIRKERGLSQSKLSEISGVNLRTLQDYEQGHKDINKASAITVFKIAQALGCTVEDLLGVERKKLTNKELADIFGYCERLSRLVSPSDAKRYYGFNFDSSISDTLNGLALLYERDENIKDFIKEDEFYSEYFELMLKDIGNLIRE